MIITFEMNYWLSVKVDRFECVQLAVVRKGYMCRDCLTTPECGKAQRAQAGFEPQVIRHTH